MTLQKTMIFGGMLENNWHSMRPALAIALLLATLRPCLVLGQTSIVLDASQQFQFAESYFTKGQYYRAVGEYERLIYFFPQEGRVELAMYRIGLSYLKGERFKQAIRAFGELIEKYKATKLSARSYLKISDCYVKLKQFGRARSTLDNLLEITQDQDVKDEALYRQGWICIEMDEWEKAHDSFERISQGNRDKFRVKHLSEDMNRRELLKPKSPTTAGLLAVVPGAGHLYCERYQDALIAFLLNGIMIYAAYEAFDQDNPGLGGLIAFFEIGLYSGNIYSAVSSAHKYNRKQKRDFLQYLKEHSVLEASAGAAYRGGQLALLYKITF